MAVWEGWKRFNQQAGYQPPAWEESDVFNNVLPWTAASAAEGLTEQHLRYKLYCVSQELLRCQEELQFLPQDALNMLRYFGHQQQQLATALAALQGAPSDEPPSAQAMRLGQAHILTAWQARIAGMQQQAVAAFEQVGWVAPADVNG